MQVIRSFRLSFKSKLSGIELPEKLRGGFIEKTVDYWKNVGNDYRSVYLDTRQDIRDRPRRAAVIGALIAGFTYLLNTNPNEEEFVEQMVVASNLLSRVPRQTNNPTSYEHVNRIFDLHNQQLLRHQSIGILSVIYREDYGKQNSLYASQCNYMRPSWKSYLTERIVDVGINGEYQILKHKMKDYDVNDEMHNSN